MGRTDWLDTLRYDHPRAWRTLWAGCITTVLFIGFLLLPSSPMLRAMGVTSVQERISAFSNALYWSSRAALNANQSMDKPHILYGNMEGIDRAGKLIITASSGDKWVRYNLALADIVILDLYGVAQQIGTLRLEDAKFEVYGDDQAVVWVRGVPFNVKLIEAGVAKPDPTPPTDIVDVAFATYYWGIAKGRPINQGGKP